MLLFPNGLIHNLLSSFVVICEMHICRATLSFSNSAIVIFWMLHSARGIIEPGGRSPSPRVLELGSPLKYEVPAQLVTWLSLFKYWLGFRLWENYEKLEFNLTDLIHWQALLNPPENTILYRLLHSYGLLHGQSRTREWSSDDIMVISLACFTFSSHTEI